MSKVGIHVDAKAHLLKRMRERALADHYFFSKFVLGHRDLYAPLHGPISRQLEDPEKRQHLFIMPRGSLKTSHVTIAGAMWMACRNPNVRILITQNTIGNAAKRLKEIEGHFQSNQLFRALFPELLPDSKCVWNQTQMQVKRPGIFAEATFTASGTRTKQTSNHYDVIFEDDTVAPDLDDMTADNVTPNPADIEQAIGWHMNLTPLFANPATGVNIDVGTPWAERDLLAAIKEKQPWFCVYERAALELDGLPDEAGEPVFPTRLSREVLKQNKATMGDYLFAANYMLRPMHADSMPFKPAWIKYYDTPPAALEVYTTVDLASDNSQTISKRTDFNVVLTAGKDKRTGLVYVLEYWAQKANPSQVIDEIVAQVKRHRPRRVGIEAVSYQNTMRHWVMERQRQSGEFFMVEQLRVGNRSKVTKIMGLQPVFAAGAIVIRTDMRELYSQLISFPYGANDDVIDALSMQLSFWGPTATAGEAAEQHDGGWRFEDAEAELRGRHKQEGGLVMDVLAAGTAPANWN